ncbi:recombinase RecA [bacterium]|nr:recombinase RecA [bacterium]
MAIINKQYGEGSVMKGRGSILNVETFPTGVASIDRALGKGIPSGRIIEIYGPESHGKTTTTLEIVAACQAHTFSSGKNKKKGVAAFIDAEHALDPEWAANIGVNMDELLLSQPDSGEEAFDIIETMARSGLVDLIIVDSVAALVPKAELEGEIGDHHVGAQARLMSKGLRKIKGLCNNTKTTIIFINQIREKVGVMFGSPEVTPGGRALKFYASIRGEVRKVGALKDGDDVVGVRTKIKIIKNKVAPPFVTAEFDICVGNAKRPVHGIDKISSLLDEAVDKKIVGKSGSWYSYKGDKFGNGANQAVKNLMGNKDLMSSIKKDLYEEIEKKFEIQVADVDEEHDPILDGDSADSDNLLDKD